MAIAETAGPCPEDTVFYRERDLPKPTRGDNGLTLKKKTPHRGVLRRPVDGIAPKVALQPREPNSITATAAVVSEEERGRRQGHGDPSQACNDDGGTSFWGEYGGISCGAFLWCRLQTNDSAS